MTKYTDEDINLVTRVIVDEGYRGNHSIRSQARAVLEALAEAGRLMPIAPFDLKLCNGLVVAGGHILHNEPSCPLHGYWLRRGEGTWVSGPEHAALTTPTEVARDE